MDNVVTSKYKAYRIHRLRNLGYSINDIAAILQLDSAMVFNHLHNTNHLTKDQQQQALDLHSKGWSMKDIANEIGCTKSTIACVIASGKAREHRYNSITMTRKDKLKLKKMYLEGIPVKKIKETFGISYGTLYRRLNSIGVQSNRDPKHNPRQ